MPSPSRSSPPGWPCRQAPTDILLPGEALTVLLDCGTYDVLIVDEDNIECELRNLDLCFDDAVWVIDDFELNTCGF